MKETCSEGYYVNEDFENIQVIAAPANLSHGKCDMELYATETGTAQEVADGVARECHRIHAQSRVLSMDDYSTDLFSETLVICIVSTTGSGLEPRAMTMFWKKLLFLTRRLESLRAVQLCECAEADEQHKVLGIDGALEPWLRIVTKSLLELIPSPSEIEILFSDHVHPRARVSLVNCSNRQVTVISDAHLDHGPNYFWATAKSNTRITAADSRYQDVRHLDFNLGDMAILGSLSWLNYSPGYLAVIHPIAHADEVENQFRPIFHIPRSYSADFLKTQRHPGSIHLCVAIVRYKTKLKVPRREVCSTYILHLRAGQRLRIKVVKGFIQLLANDKPVICIGPGTDNTLYFGCRSAEKDQHYASEWQGYVAEHKLAPGVACSRDDLEGSKRTYAQNLITEDAARIWKLLNKRNACVLISGI
ncbi:NADPH-ferrihemo protein reductase [Lentinula raphanica]|nr:NADPH-ferrihemo protein reductase [Lentinula raphanica]